MVQSASNTLMDNPFDIEGFRDWMNLFKNQKVNTRTRHLRNATKYLEGSCGVSDFDSKLKFLSSLKSNGIKNATLANYIKTFRLMNEYEVSQGGEDYRGKLPRFKITVPEVDILTVEEIDAILAVEGSYQLIIELLARTGRRISEVVELKKDHYDHSRMAMKLAHPKSGVPSWKPVPPDLGKKLHGLQKGDGYFFPALTDPKKHIAPQVVNREIKRRAEVAGIRKRVYAHLFRHSFPVELLRQGVPLPIVSELLDHNDFETTKRYIHMVLDDMSDALRSHRLNQNTQSSIEIYKFNKNRIQRHLKPLQTYIHDGDVSGIEIQESEKNGEYTLKLICHEI